MKIQFYLCYFTGVNTTKIESTRGSSESYFFANHDHLWGAINEVISVHVDKPKFENCPSPYKYNNLYSVPKMTIHHISNFRFYSNFK